MNPEMQYVVLTRNERHNWETPMTDNYGCGFKQ